MSEETARFHAKILGKINNGKGHWGSLHLGIFEGELQVGEYTRNYPSYGLDTFCPFEQDGQWYALYSPHYTATRLMSLPDCKDLGGEEPSGSGFCPTAYLIPELCRRDPAKVALDPEPTVANHDVARWVHKVPSPTGGVRYYWPDDKDHPEPNETKKTAYLAEKARSHQAHKEWDERNPLVLSTAPYAFVSGCHWGDDSSWKVQYIDLSRVREGIITRSERFGYVELPRGVKLADAIHADDEGIWVQIAVPVRFDLKTGKKLED